jgi:hypothetical protein
MRVELRLGTYGKGRTELRHRVLSPDAEQTEADRVTLSLAGLALALLLVVVGLFLVQHLRDKARVEDCLLSGRLNCDQLVMRQ